MNFEQFSRDLADYPPKHILFLALGNERRGDDGAGLLLANLLRDSAPFRRCRYIFARTNPENHLQQILDAKPELVVCIDAAHRGLPPGSIEWIDPADLDACRSGTHAFSIALIEKYINFHQPVPFKYLGIEPMSMELNTRITPFIMSGIALFFANIRQVDTAFVTI